LGAGDESDVAINLLEMARINRYLGGVQAITRHLYPLLVSVRQTVIILDLGTGSGHLLKTIAGWARRNRRRVKLVGLDRSNRCLAVAHEQGDSSQSILLLQADASCLPILDGGVDFIISSLFLHHFSPPEVIELLRLAYAKARYGLLMSDLVRGEMPYLAFNLIRPAFARHPMTRYDGALSIRRAYVSTELSQLAQEAGIDDFKIYSHWPWRMTMVALKGINR